MIKVDPVDGSTFSITDWEEFKSSRMWAAVCFEIAERDKYIMELLRYGDPEGTWGDQEMRARLNELEFVQAIPDVMITDIKMQMTRVSKEETIEDNEKGD